MQLRRQAMRNLAKCGKLAGHVRDWVNDGDDGKFKEVLLADDKRWLPTCVSMDILEDSLEAIRYYLRHGLSRDKGRGYNASLKTIGGRYLRLYGVLQALSLNQDAIANLHSCLLQKQYKWAKDSAWNRVRRIRVCIAGHPHDADTEGPSFLSRPELGTRGFSFHSYKNRKELKAVDVDLDAEINAYLVEASGVLSEMTKNFPVNKPISFGLIK